MAGDDPIIDPGAMGRLREWGGATLKVKMIELFLENAPERVQGVGRGLADEDFELAERSAHSLKSSAANLGAEAVRGLSARIEEALERKDTPMAKALLPELESKFEATLDALEKARSEEPT